MKPILAILAHESAQPTIDDFLPKWNQLDARIICYVPVGHLVTGFDEVRHIGESAHAGNKVFRRFIDTLKDLLTTDADNFVVIEYDTVNRHPLLPKATPGKLVSYLVTLHRHCETSGPMQLCSLSPWVMDRTTMEIFIATAERILPDDPDGADISGLLDRWIGNVIERGPIPAIRGGDMLGYPYHPGIHDRITRMGYNWIHGWKRKEDFGDLWT